MLHTPVCGLLGIEYPILQGAMGWISGGKLAAAVSNGGGLGIIAASNMDVPALRAEIRLARSLTDKPFAVNVMLMSPHVEDIARLVLEERVPILTTGGGSPARFMGPWLAAGMKVLPVVASTRNALSAIRAGATALIAEGSESGGHVGEICSMTLIPQICGITDLPVLAAGGIANGRGLAAAFMLGAQGVQIGTRFLAATECDIHPTYKKWILEATDAATVVTGRRVGICVRSLKTDFTHAYQRAEYDSAVTDGQLRTMGEGALRRAAVDGDEQNGCYMAGQCVSLVNKEQPAAEIIREIVAEAGAALASAGSLLK